MKTKINNFNKSILKHNFNKAACDYHKLANFQQEVAQELCSFAALDIKQANNIVDLGCGTGFVGQNIKKLPNFKTKNLFQVDLAEKMLSYNKNTGNNIYNVVSDIEKLNLEDSFFDLALSSLSFQWLNNINLAFKEIKQVLKPNSNLIFSILIDGTLVELKKCLKELDLNLSVNDFIKLEDLEEASSLEFKNFTLVIKNIIVKYNNIYELLHSIKDIGACYSTKKRSDYSLKSKDFQNINDFYLNNYNMDKKLYSTWKVAFVKLSK